MEARELELAERIARAMPGDRLDMGSTEDPKVGMIYIATKVDKERCPHGFWACQGTARTLHFKPDTDLGIVRQVLVNDAASFVEDLQAKGVFSNGH